MDKRIIEGIESCRPGSDDLRSDDLSDLAHAVQRDPLARLAYEHAQRRDAAIAAAMEQVPLPPGLAERIVDRLKASSAADSTRLEQAIDDALRPAEIDVTASAVEIAPRLSRRRLWIVVTGVAASVMVAVFLGQWLQPQTDDPLEALAAQWLRDVESRGSAWRGVAQAVPRGLKVPPAVSASPTSWQPIAGGNGVAYKLEHAKAGSAMLYVVRMSRAGLPSAPPAEPQLTTGGKAIGYWQAGGVIYVLVVPGDQRSYRSFVGSAPIPLA